jgi:hypothetical protein
MSMSDVEHVYSLYNRDDDVILFDRLSDARNAKSRLEQVVDVEGPFSHPRHELPLLRAAAKAARDLRTLDRENPSRTADELGRIASDLEEAVRLVYPLRRLPLEDGELVEVHPNSPDDASE